MNCHRLVNTQAPASEYKAQIAKTIELVHEVRNAVDNEPRTASEVGGK